MATYRLKFDGKRLVFPRYGDEADFDFSSWMDAQDVLARFCRATLKGRRLKNGQWVDADVALVHRGDNTYNPNAISVSMPASFGGNLDSRHMGYFFDHELREIGMPLLADLAEHVASKAGKPVELICTARVWGPDELTLYLPEGAVLREAILEFLGPSHPAKGTFRKAAPRPKPTPLPPRADRVHTARVPETDEALAWLGSFPGTRQPVERVAFSLQLNTRGATRGNCV